MPSLLEARTLSFGYSGHAPVLDAVSLALRRGEVCALLGPNGAGKTTFLRLLLGLLRPTGGEVLLEGVPLHSLTGRKRAKRMAYVPQEALPRFSMTVFDAVLLGRKPHMRWGPDKTTLPAQAKRWPGWDWNPCTTPSGGAFRRTAAKDGFGASLVQDTDWLLLDEPVSSLDLRHQIEVLDMARRVAETRNLGVLLSLHDVNLAIRFAHT